MKCRRIVGIAATGGLALGESVAMGLPAQAKDSSSASAHGTCSATSTYKVNATGKKDTIDVKAKVATDLGGEAWTYTFADNGTSVVTGDVTTSGSGKFKVRSAIPNLEGIDTIDFMATDSVTGETCAAQIAYSG